ncbi:MAG: response regulator transcription factor [Candidatus Sulfotelmatobacter sp.]|jgi:DNA-binding NarL/FixJ family response regulator
MAQLTSFPQQDRIRVLAADNTAMNTQLLVETLARDSQFNVASPASKEAEILAVVKRERSDVALISARQGTDSRGGFVLSREICSSSPGTRVIMLLDTSERTPVVEAFRAGARGVFCRTESLKLLAKSIRCVHEGQIWANSNELQFVLQAMVEPVPMKFLSASGDSLLSAREVDVVRCVAEGLSNREIAQRLNLREHTVKNYLFRIFDKLGVSSRVEVVLYALGNHSGAAGSESPAPSKKEPPAAPLIPSADLPVRIMRR